MDEMISYCGLLCHECGALIATLNDDNEKRAEVARLWSKEFHKEFKPEDINCLGCLSEDEPVFGYCNICNIRSCAKTKSVINCAYCDDYACDQLMEFFQMAPANKNRLDHIRENL
jgi:hypothetical protein